MKFDILGIKYVASKPGLKVTEFPIIFFHFSLKTDETHKDGKANCVLSLGRQ